MQFKRKAPRIEMREHPLYCFHAFLRCPSFTAADDAFDPVLDTTGEKVLRGAQYHILPTIHGNGGGLIVASQFSGRTCQRVTIVQDSNEANKGLPLSFSPATNDHVVQVATDLNIKYSINKVCHHTPVWRFDANDHARGPYFVTLGGVEGNPGRETLSNWFKIQKFEDAYKLQYCPTVCGTCRVICRDIGIVLDHGNRRLALSDRPFKVIFKKA
ncbi:unnamed protein product [Ilex paraguariensis]|uniref:Uncharacterized protein n=1 Tax=Ilex paraguariensis TaxID=185542 RepID=A0ABC8S553_9AQUA